MAGPYTEKAIGDAPAETQAPDVAEAYEEQGVENSDSIERPYREQVKTSLSVNDPNYAWRPNFNPEQDPRVIGQTAHNGKYGGDPIFDRTSPIFVGDAIASRQKANAMERKSLDAMAAKLSDPFADIDDLDRAEYRNSYFGEAYNQLMQEQQEAIALTGDTREAMRQINDPNTPLGKQHKKRVEAINTIAMHINTAQKEANETIRGMESAELMWDQDTYDEAQEILHAYSSPGGGDAVALAKKTVGFTNLAEFNKWAKSSGMDEALQRSAIETDTLGKPRYAGGKVIFDKNTVVRTPEERIKEFIEATPPGFRMRLGDEKLEKIYRAKTPEKNLQDPIVQNPPGSDRAETPRGKRDGWIDGGWQQGGIRIDLQDQGKVEGTHLRKSGKPLHVEHSKMALKLRRDQDGEWVDLKPIALRNGNNVNVFMQPQELARRGGRWFVSGKQYAYPKQQAAGSSSAGVDLQEDAAPSAEQEFKELGTVMVPVENNEDWLRSYGIQGNLDEFIRGFPAAGKQLGGQAQEKPPIEGAQKAPDGSWYVKKSDGWYKVQ